MVEVIAFTWAMVLLPEAGGAFDTGLRYRSFEDCSNATAAADVQMNEGTLDRAAMQRMVCLPVGTGS